MFDPREISALVPVLLNHFSNNKKKRIEKMHRNLKTTAKYYRWKYIDTRKTINSLLRRSIRKKQNKMF